MIDSNIKFRHEWKYIISNKDRVLLDRRLSNVMKTDKNGDNGCYTIRSLYFDDMYNSAYNEKLAGTPARKKYRIRIYNFSESLIKLECKNKRDNYIYKESSKLSKEEYYRIINEDYSFMLHKDDKLCKDFYIECVTKKMRPRVYVDYERKTFVMDEGNVRITFDSNIRAVAPHYDIFDEHAPSFECMQPEMLVLEVKYTDLYPGIVKSIISPDYSIFTAVSKYVLCCEKRMEMAI